MKFDMENFSKSINVGKSIEEKQDTGTARNPLSVSDPWWLQLNEKGAVDLVRKAELDEPFEKWSF